MAYNIYQNDEKIATTDNKEYTVTGLEPNTEYSFSVSEVIGDKESEKSEAVTVTTLPIEVVSRETLEMAIENADVGDTIKLAGGFTVDEDVLVGKDVTIDGNGHTVIGDVESGKACFRITDTASFENMDIELSGDGNRAFTLHTMATGFNLKDSSITGEDTSVEGHRGIGSSIEGEGDVIVDNVVFNGLRIGLYQVGNHHLDVNDSTFESNHRGLTVEGSSVPTLTNNTFTNNDGDIGAAYDSEIKGEIAQEAENPDNNNTFDGDKPKYNWVTGVTVSPKTNNLEVGGTRTLNATVEPSTAKQDVTWSSDNDEVATVSSDGTVTAIAEGEATITVTAEGKTDTATVNVTEPEPEPEPEPDPEDPKE